MPGSITPRDDLPQAERLRITEIFYSIQGEARPSGFPTVFIRLTGCPLRCGYCDTAYAFTGGEWQTLEQVLATVAGFEGRYVCVTGGEPLAQQNCQNLLTALCEANYEVSLETSGALDIGGVDERVTIVMDLKTPGSGELERNLWDNLRHLKPQDQLKFVICDRADYEWACEKVREEQLTQLCAVLFSPSQDQIEARELAEWILEDRLQVRFQVQLHKYLWGNEAGH